MTLTAMRPVVGLENGREVVVFRVAHVVDLRFQRAAKTGVRIVRCAGEVRVTDEETLVVIVRVDEPARNVVRIVRAYLARNGHIHVHALQLNLNLTVRQGNNLDVRLAKNAERRDF